MPFVVLVITIVVMNVVDVYGTLWHVGHGATEVNPLMAMMLDVGPVSFCVVKYLSCAVTYLAAACFVRDIRRLTRLVAIFVLPLYVILAVYQFVGPIVI